MDSLLPQDAFQHVQSFLSTVDVCHMFSLHRDFQPSNVHSDHVLTIRNLSLMSLTSMNRFSQCNVIYFVENNIQQTPEFDYVLRNRTKILNLEVVGSPRYLPFSTLVQLDICLNIDSMEFFRDMDQSKLIELNIFVHGHECAIPLYLLNLKIFRSLGNVYVVPIHTTDLEVVCLRPRHFEMLLPGTLDNLQTLHFFRDNNYILQRRVVLPNLNKFHQEVEDMSSVDVNVARQSIDVELRVDYSTVASCELMLCMLLSSTSKTQRLVVYVEHLLEGTTRRVLFPPLQKVTSCSFLFGINLRMHSAHKEPLERWVNGLRGGKIEFYNN
jgi:hypothetical protein